MSDRPIVWGAAAGILGSMDAITQVPLPANEPVHDYAPQSPERARLRAELAALADHPIDLPHVIGGRHRMGDGDPVDPEGLGELSLCHALAVPCPLNQHSDGGLRCHVTRHYTALHDVASGHDRKLLNLTYIAVPGCSAPTSQA